MENHEKGRTKQDILVELEFAESGIRVYRGVIKSKLDEIRKLEINGINFRGVSSDSKRLVEDHKEGIEIYNKRIIRAEEKIEELKKELAEIE